MTKKYFKTTKKRRPKKFKIQDSINNCVKHLLDKQLMTKVQNVTQAVNKLRVIWKQEDDKCLGHNPCAVITCVSIEITWIQQSVHMDHISWRQLLNLSSHRSWETTLNRKQKWQYWTLNKVQWAPGHFVLVINIKLCT